MLFTIACCYVATGISLLKFVLLLPSGKTNGNRCEFYVIELLDEDTTCKHQVTLSYNMLQLCCC